MPNPLLRRVPRAEMNEYCQSAYDGSMKLLEDASVVEVGANAPHIFEWYRSGFYNDVFKNGGVDAVSMELLRGRLAYEHGCVYCQIGDTVAAYKAGITEEQWGNILNEDAPCFSPKERAVIRLATQMALPNMHGELTPELYGELRNHFTDGQIYTMGMAAAVLNGMAKMIFVYDLVEKDAACPIVPRRADLLAAAE